MVDIPKNYYSNLSCYEDFVVRTTILGLDLSDSELYDYLIGRDNIRTVHENFYFFVVGDDASRHLCIIDRKGNHIENAVIEGDFNCSLMNLTSLKGGPGEVNGSFNCSNNDLTSLEGSPRKVNRNFYCSYNSLVSLEGAPWKVGRYFDCSYNSLTSLVGGPGEVGGNFYCLDNKLTSLEGAPIKVGGNFYCFKNNLISLEGAPIKVGGYFNCSDNNLTDNQFQEYKKWLKTKPIKPYHDPYAT